MPDLQRTVRDVNLKTPKKKKKKKKKRR